MPTVDHYRSTLRDRGFCLRSKHVWLVQIKLSNGQPLSRTFCRLTGDRVRIDGVTLSVDNPLVTTRRKGSLFFGIYEIAERYLAT